MKLNNALVTLDKVSKIFNKTYKALDDCTFSMFPGTTLGLLGANGSGKTTCSAILGGVLQPTSGEILFEDNPVLDMPEYRKHVGYCPQSNTLHKDLSVYENLRTAELYFGLNPKFAKQNIEQYIEMFELHKVLDKYPTMLSGGYLQRVMLARTLIPDPKVVILDEPTVGLDHDIRKKLWNIILDLKKMNKSFLLTTHYLDEAEVLCDNICILSHGKIIYHNTKENLQKSNEKQSFEEIFSNIIEQHYKETV